MNAEQKHFKYLHDFIKPKYLAPVLKTIDARLDDLVSIIIEPEFYHHSMEHYSMPDYIFKLSNGVMFTGEMKSSQLRRDKAFKQLVSGKLYCEEMFDYSPNLGLFVAHEPNGYFTRFYNI